MTLGEFCTEMERGEELLYLTTQKIPEDSDGSPVALAAPHVLRLLSGARRLRPKLVGKLVPVQYNLWFGRSSAGTTSGLHHDFHDNLYIMLRGEKEFRLFSPRCVDLLKPAGAQRRRPRLHANGLLCYASGIRDDGAPEAVVRAWRRRSEGASARADAEDDEEEALLEDALNAAMDGSDWEEEHAAKVETPAVPDSFCRASTMSSVSGTFAPVPEPLQGRHLTAALTGGDILYLPASWFHEVISRGSDAGGHLALNVWMAPPHAGGSFEQPYEDGFWEGRYHELQGAHAADLSVHSTRRARRRLPWTHRGALRGEGRRRCQRSAFGHSWQMT